MHRASPCRTTTGNRGIEQKNRVVVSTPINEMLRALGFEPRTSSMDMENGYQSECNKQFGVKIIRDLDPHDMIATLM